MLLRMNSFFSLKAEDGLEIIVFSATTKTQKEFERAAAMLARMETGI